MTTAAKPPMDFSTYWVTVGTDNILKIVEHIGSSIKYFQHIKCGTKGVSPRRALAIIEAARIHTPGFEPDFNLMIFRNPPAVRPRTAKIPPSAEFLAAQAPSEVPA